MTLIAPQERRLTKAPQQQNGADALPEREIKYRQDAANYVAAMLAELRNIAGKAGFDQLVSAIDTAYYEAYGALDSRPKQPADRHGKNNGAAVEPEAG